MGSPRAVACRRAVAALTVATLLGPCLGCVRDDRPPRLVLLGIDGGSWNLLDPMLARGELPHLAAVVERGVTAHLTAVEPLISPTVWTSIATGRGPEAHGVTLFYATRHSVRVPTVWDRFAASGLRVGLYDWLVAWPPRAEPGGFSVPGWLRRDDAVAPPDLFQRIGLPPYSYTVDNLDGAADLLVNVESELREKPRYWRRLWEEFEPDVGAVIFYSLDAVCHRFYHHAFPRQFIPPLTGDLPHAGVIRRTLLGLDEAVGEIAATLEPEDHLVIVSDHGFRAGERIDTIWAFDAARLLESAGLPPRQEDVTVLSEFWYLAFRIEPGPERRRRTTLERLRAALAGVRANSGDPLFRLQLVDPAAPLPEGLPAVLARTVRAQQPAFSFLFAIPQPEVLAALGPSSAVTVGGRQVALGTFAASHEFSGQHDPVGVFLAAGGGVRHLPRRLRLSVLDVAPLLAYLAGQPIPDDLEGRLPRGLILPARLASEPPRTVPASQLPRLTDDRERATGPEYDPELERRLRALGYL